MNGRNLLILLFVGIGFYFFSPKLHALVQQEKPLVVVIPSYCNKDWYQKNVDSVMNQKYSNYRVIYIDDASPDGTYELVKAHVEKHNQQDKWTIIKNEQNMGAMANHYTAVHMCKDEEIILHLDGDDWLKHEHVLKKVNDVYKDNNVWLTYGQFECYPSGEKGFCRPFPNAVKVRNAYRKYIWLSSHLRTFYAWLFKKIDKKDFEYNGKFLEVTCDRAMMYPLLEMAGNHMRCIDEVLYVYNHANPICDMHVRLKPQLAICNYICNQKPYLPLTRKDVPNFAHA